MRRSSPPGSGFRDHHQDECDDEGQEDAQERQRDGTARQAEARRDESQTIDERPSASAILAIAPQAAIDESLGPWLYWVTGHVAARIGRIGKRPATSFRSRASRAELFVDRGCCGNPRVIHDELADFPSASRHSGALLNSLAQSGTFR